MRAVNYEEVYGKFSGQPVPEECEAYNGSLVETCDEVAQQI